MEARGTGSGVPKASLAGFVSTSVLTSSDGLFGDNVEEKRVTEAPAPRAEDAAGYKPLYEQLQERREQKDSGWKEKNNPFAPPKGLDEEEFEYIKDLESMKEDSERKRQAQHEEDLAQFLVARGAPKAGGGAALTAQQLQKFPAKNDFKTAAKKKAPVVVVRAKRKAEKDKPRKATSKSVEPHDTVKGEPVKKKQKTDAKDSSDAPVEKKAKPNTAALGLMAYGSDSDSDSDS
ncbi:hypothetical protein PHYSODRAFT_309966 [Phytophthora sojae]|uniref:FAM192A/Fyv6 N-terminal domain-containing protein n=1 Tax=Phytophthora sojae (strain P6497) TaxID=1094619 RepID=G4YL43_PHYSP|nr:hypothetical protein PHYSODRAFT_309966 [Phytophthora sojae]EGZ29798.1 hypothetical protein PHYSODRAFT_309966 [Phytophthora sojae]|eukprot:XP_009517073.1 hypothetical protein PHYSODRAFT_309966 [Phytophthora sojae]